MITLSFAIGRGYLIVVSGPKKALETLREHNIVDKYNFLLDYHPDVILKIRELVPYETITVKKDVHKLLKRYDKVMRLDIQSYQPPSLKLEPHQIENIRRTLLLKHIINADDTGLGKTISAIGFLNVLYNLPHKSNPNKPWLQNLLVITPSSLIDKWVENFHEFSYIPIEPIPSLAGKDPLTIRELFTSIPYKIISMDTFKRYSQYLPTLYDAIIIDEIHHMKNRKTNRASSIAPLMAPYKMFISATPLINSPNELHYISSLLNPNLLGSLYDFENEFYDIDVISLPSGIEIRKIVRISPHQKEKLQRIVGSYITRHTWEDTNLSIPTKSHNIIQPLSPVQDEIYNLILKKFKYKMGIELLTYLQEVCNSPLLIKRKLSAWGHAVSNIPIGWKIDYLLDTLLPQIFKSHNQVVIFTRYQQYVNMVAPLLSEHYETAVITGETPRRKRTQLIKSFREGEFVIMLADDALSYGQDLQTATAVINLELPLSPAVYDQRVGRIRRMGQSKSIEVYDLITEHTIEQDIAELIKSKREYFRDIVDETRYIQNELFQHLSQSVSLSS